MELLSLVWLFTLILLGGWVVSQMIAPLALRFVGDTTTPDLSRRRLWLTALLPWLLPLLAVAVLAFLAGAKPLGILQDHCTYHDPHHPHFCFEHLPQMLLSYPHALIGGGLVGILLVLFLRYVRRERIQAQRIATLTTLAPGHRVLKTINDAGVFAFAAGWRQPRIFLSQGLRQSLSKHECRIVLAHEVAHVRQGDLWRNLVFESLLVLSVAPLATRLRARWRMNMEAQADDRVARRFGATEVASVLLKLAKLPAASPAATSIAGSELAQRIERLVHTPSIARRTPWFEWVFWSGLGMFALILMQTHHTLETLLGFVVGV